MECIGYWSQTKDDRHYPAQITAKVNCSLLSIGSFRVAPILSKAGIFGKICGLGEYRGFMKILSLCFVVHQQVLCGQLSNLSCIVDSLIFTVNFLRSIGRDFHHSDTFLIETG
jgi:hypothetical protein